MEKVWEVVTKARSATRFKSEDVARELFTDFIELAGDRLYGDDKAVKCGIAKLNDMYVTLIMQVKGKDTKENIERNFAMCMPDGYRKSLRIAKQAEKFNRPIICLVDTPGAYCGVEAEKLGQGEAIARNLFEFSNLKVPVLSIVVGEGGSGGALALATSDEVWMFENSIYSVLSPEGFSSILFKNPGMSKEAAKIMKLTSSELKEMDVIEKVIKEEKDGKEIAREEVFSNLKDEVYKKIVELSEKSEKKLLDDRYKRFRKFGIYDED